MIRHRGLQSVAIETRPCSVKAIKERTVGEIERYCWSGKVSLCWNLWASQLGWHRWVPWSALKKALVTLKTVHLPWWGLRFSITSGSRGEWIYPVFASPWGWVCLDGMRASLPQSLAVRGLTEKSRGIIEDKSEGGVVRDAEDSVCSCHLGPMGTVGSGEQCGSEKPERPSESCGHCSSEGDGG